MKKIFIIGTITSKIPQEFKEIEENLKKDFSNQVISTYDEHSQGNEKMNWVFNNIENSSLIVALFPQISFGTSFELGYSIAKDKNILLITLEDVYEKIKFRKCTKK